jgi:hypothetical protein
VDCIDWRRNNVHGLITARYLRPYDPTLDPPVARSVVKPSVEPSPAVAEADPADPYGVKAAQEHLAACEDAQAQACEAVETLLTAVCAVAGKYGDWQRAVDLGWAFFVQERDRGFRQEGEAVGARYAQACEVAQHRLQALEEAQDALQQAQDRTRQAEERAWVQANHPDLLTELAREQARLRRINRSAENGAWIAQRHTLRQVEEKIRDALKARDANAA